MWIRKRNISITLDSNLIDTLDEYADAMMVNRSALINTVLRDFVEKLTETPTPITLNNESKKKS